jgi:hypothetical protein
MAPSQSTSLPQLAYNDGPEVMQPGPELAQPQPGYESTSLAPRPSKGSTILGLRRPTFWISLILLVVVIIAAVGGGVGGSLAVKNAKSVLPLFPLKRKYTLRDKID